MRPRGRGAVERALRRCFARLLRQSQDGVRRNGRGWSRPRFGPGAEIAPETAFDVQTRERMRGLEDGLREVKGRVNGLIFLEVGAVVAQVALRFLG